MLLLSGRVRLTTGCKARRVTRGTGSSGGRQAEVSNRGCGCRGGRDESGRGLGRRDLIVLDARLLVGVGGRLGGYGLQLIDAIQIVGLQVAAKRGRRRSRSRGWSVDLGWTRLERWLERVVAAAAEIGRHVDEGHDHEMLARVRRCLIAELFHLFATGVLGGRVLLVGDGDGGGGGRGGLRWVLETADSQVAEEGFKSRRRASGRKAV